MSRIRSRNTSLEHIVFRFLWRERIHFQRHYKRAPGAPDVAVPRKKRAVFIDGDFWHGWKYDKRNTRLPKDYWRGKIEGNIRRDKARRAWLKRNGWEVMRIWEHELKKHPDATLEKVKKFLT